MRRSTSRRSARPPRNSRVSPSTSSAGAPNRSASRAAIAATSRAPSTSARMAWPISSSRIARSGASSVQVPRTRSQCSRTPRGSTGRPLSAIIPPPSPAAPRRAPRRPAGCAPARRRLLQRVELRPEHVGLEGERRRRGVLPLRGVGMVEHPGEPEGHVLRRLLEPVAEVGEARLVGEGVVPQQPLDPARRGSPARRARSATPPPPRAASARARSARRRRPRSASPAARPRVLAT